MAVEEGAWSLYRRGGVTPGGGTVGGGGIPGGPGGPLVDTKTCMTSSGQLQASPALGTEQLPSCTDFTFPQSCGIGPDGGCPSLRGDCVRASAWLSANAPADAKPRPNVFESLVACEKGKLSAADHPAIENAAASLGTCRQLCGPGDRRMSVRGREPNTGSLTSIRRRLRCATTRWRA